MVDLDCISSVYYNPESLTDLTVVLDLDETLVHTFMDINQYELYNKFHHINDVDLMRRTYLIEMNDVASQIGKGEHEKMWGVFRPYVDEFLKFAFGYFKYVIVWSAGLDRYVEQIVEKLFSGLSRPDIVYGRSNCSQGTMIVNDNPVTFNHKPLARLIEEQQLDVDMRKIVLVDDKTYSFTDNPDNSILIPGYIPEPTPDSMRMEDTHLLKLMWWLLRDDVMTADDIRTIDRTNIFNDDIVVTVYDINNAICRLIE